MTDVKKVAAEADMIGRTHSGFPEINYITDKIYGGVLGKLSGVRLGIPFENQDASEIRQSYPHITGYVLQPEKDGKIMHPDDDTNGFAFIINIFEEISSVSELTPEAAAHCLLNFVSADRGFFWWQDGFAEHGAFHHLLKGASPFVSGDYEHIGQACNHVGGQIFYDAVGLIFAGRPKEDARCAGIVSGVMHRGEGAVGGRFICACISAAFTENDLKKIINIGLSVIPEESCYARTVRDILNFYERYPNDWESCLAYIEAHYHSYMIWDYTAVILLSLLYGGGNFSKSMEICAHCGGDTDGSCGTIGTILGALGGWQAIPYRQWIAPMNDVLYCSSALPGENEVSITRLTARIIRLYCKFSAAVCPKYIEAAAEAGSYSFAMPYAYQNIQAHLYRDHVWRPDLVSRMRSLRIKNGEVTAPSGCVYSLKFEAEHMMLGDCIRICRWFSHDITEFISLKYEPALCPGLYPGQTVSINVMVPPDNGYTLKMCLMAFDNENEEELRSAYIEPTANQWYDLNLTIPRGNVFYQCINIEIIPEKSEDIPDRKDKVTVYFDDLKIIGIPDYTASVVPAAIDAHYPVIKDFSVCYNPEHFPLILSESDSGAWSRMPSYNHTHLMMMITGPAHMSQYDAFCSFIIEAGDTFLMNIAVRGNIDHYAAGIYKNRISILKTERIPGEYTELCVQPAGFQFKEFTENADEIIYTYDAKIYSRDIIFKVIARCKERTLMERTLYWHTDTLLKGCIGFTSFEGCRIRILHYGVKPLDDTGIQQISY